MNHTERSQILKLGLKNKIIKPKIIRFYRHLQLKIILILIVI